MVVLLKNVFWKANKQKKVPWKSVLFFFKIIIFIFGSSGSPWLCRLFSSWRERVSSLVVYTGLSSWWLLLLWSADSGAHRLQLRLLGSRAQVRWLRLPALASLRYEGSSWIRDQPHVPCIGRWILYHWATREAPIFFSFYQLILKELSKSLKVND